MHLSSAVRLLFVCLLGIVPPASANTIYVSTAGNNTHDGLSWQTAKQTVQAGLNAAQPGDQVWVAAGTYVENITLTLEVELYAGFAGTETDLSQRNWHMNEAILDGNQAGSVVTAPTGATTSTRIDGFTIRNGNGTLSSTLRYGGGIYCSSSSPTIANNTITANTAYRGGGIHCDCSSPMITNNTLTGNTTGNAGSGISCAASSSPLIVGNTITGNTTSSGGGIFCVASSPTIANNIISNNTTDYTGGGICCRSSSPTITNNTISNNTTTYSGGGICCESSSPTITHNAITRNTSSDSGGGIDCCENSSSTIANNAIVNNTAESGAGITCSSSSSTIINNTITGNTASGTGGGILGAWSSSLTITGNTIAGNSAQVNGGIDCGAYSSLTITNTIIAFNAGGLSCEATSSTPTLRYCCVYGNGNSNFSGLTDPTGTNGNISADPQLADIGRYNVHLQPTSPCIDAGDDAAVQTGSTDMDSQARVLGAHVDIGADESDGTLWPAAPPIIYASPSGNDSNDGLSWATAKRTVQAAIDAGGTGSQVWVAAGTYIGTVCPAFGMALYGGFAGNETDLSQRDWRTNETILDGNRAGNAVKTPPGATASTRIDGFTIRNARAEFAGGILCLASSPTITNNTITDNSAYGDSCPTGGGISCYDSSPTITNNTITRNSAYGGGIYCNSSSPTIMNNTITGNSGSAGGIFCYYYSSPTITDNTITGNSGGAICCMDSSPTITNNTITGNRGSYGGGIACMGGSSTIINNTITSNNAHDAGGGIYCNSASPTIMNNTITGNTAFNSGGGIACYYSSPTITGNTITGNTINGAGCEPPALGLGGGGIYCLDSSPTIANTIIAFNSSGIYSDGSTPTLRYSCVYANSDYNYSGLTDPTGLDGNISSDPLFLQAPNPGPDGIWATPDDLPANLRLATGSPCINTGDPAYTPAASETDLDGLPRALYTSVDIGAYEYQKPGDVNGDGYINVGDLQGLVTAWATQKPQPGWSPGADLNRDRYINVGDLQILVANWGL